MVIELRLDGAGRRGPLLKISINEDEETATLKLEGKLVGPWVSELERVWLSKEQYLATKKLFLDMRGTTYVDEDGIKMLRKIFQMTDVEVLADSPLTRYFAAVSARELPPKSRKDV